MSEPATPEEQEQHAARLKMADDKWAELVADAHYEDAADIHKWYWTVGFTHGLRAAQAEIDKLREAIRRLAEQDATLSVCDGNVTVTMDATPGKHTTPSEGSAQERCTLTDAEREAVDEAADTSDVAAAFYSGKDHARADAAAKHAATLRGLLERLGDE